MMHAIYISALVVVVVVVDSPSFYCLIFFLLDQAHLLHVQVYLWMPISSVKI